MHVVKLNIQDSVSEQFMRLIDILPKQGLQLKQIDDVSSCPNISHDEACQKVERLIINISKNLRQPVNQVFNEILN